MNNILFNSRRTPVDVDYPSCDLTYVEFVVYIEGKFISVSDILGMNPTNSQKVSDLIINKRGIEREAKSTYWCLSSEEKVVSKDIRHHLNWLLNILVDKKKDIFNIQKFKGVNMNVNGIWFAASNGGPTIWPEQMKTLSDLNLEFSISLY